MKYYLSLLLFFLPLSLYTDEVSDRLAIEEVEKGVYLYTSYYELPGSGFYPANGLIINYADEAYMIDTPWSEEATREAVDWIRGRGWKLSAAIFTHSHHDRVAGLGYLNGLGVRTYASKKTKDLLSAASAPVANHVMENKDARFAGGRIEVHFPGEGHSTDNLVVWLAQHKILFAGCLVKDLSATDLGGIGDANFEQWPATVENVSRKYSSARRIIPGHGEMGDMGLLDHTSMLIAEHKKAARP